MQVTLKLKLGKSITLLKDVSIAHAPAPGDCIVDENEEFRVDRTLYRTEPAGIIVKPIVVLRPIALNDVGPEEVKRCIQRWEIAGWWHWESAP